MVTALMIQRGIEVNLPVSAARSRRSRERRGHHPPAYRRDRKLYLRGVVHRRRRAGARPAEDGRRGRKDVTLKGDVKSIGEMAEVTDLLKAAGAEHVARTKARTGNGRVDAARRMQALAGLQRMS